MKTRTLLMLGAAAMYFYGPKLTQRAKDAMDDMAARAKDAERTNTKSPVMGNPEGALDL